MKRSMLLSAAAIAVIQSCAEGSPITLFTETLTASAQNPAPPDASMLGPGGRVGGVGGPDSFVMPFDGEFTLTLDDCCLVGDVYQAFVDGASLGFTSAVPIGGSLPSTGSFSSFLAAGPHSFDVSDQILSYIGVASPYGGGIVPSVYSPAGLTATGTAVAPEPATFVSMGTALLVVGLWRRRSRVMDSAKPSPPWLK